MCETDADRNTIRYIRGYELISSDSEKAKTYYHYASDELGSTTHVTDEAGKILNRYEYDAFGNFTVKEEKVENRFCFTGEQYDPASNLYYLRARFYSPAIGRFLNEDTYYGDGLNLYAYCHNNPVGYVDPSGHDACPVAVKKYKDQGYSEEEANIKATYDAMLKEQGERLAKYNLDRQIAELKKNGYQFSDAWNTNNILNKPISKWTDAELQRAIDSIHNAQFGGKWYGNLSPMAVTVGPDGRVVVTKNNGPVRPESKAGQMAIKIFGEGVELPYGKGSNYPIKVANAHAEARGIQAFINGDTEVKFGKTVRQACSHNSCIDCADKQKTHEIKNITGKVTTSNPKIGRDYISDLWE